jgi:uncharacterized protein YfkK (UPF0435 family)
MLGEAKMRAKAKGLPFNLELSDIIIPEVCPVLGIPIRGAADRFDYQSASLDRLIPKLGYVKGNVNVISMRANTVKNNSTYEELEQVYRWVKKKTLSLNKSLSQSRSKPPKP